MSAGGYISSNGYNFNINKSIFLVNKQLKKIGVDIIVKSANYVIIYNKNFFEITAKVSEQLQILYALNGILSKAENLMNDYLYNHANADLPELKITYIR